MLTFKTHKPSTGISTQDKTRIVDFLYTHLEEFGDEKHEIEESIKFAMKEIESFGGFVLEGFEKDDLAGIVVINHTGMKGYIPENILVYIAVNNQMRGKGFGKELMKKAVSLVDGDVALHVEKDNPARFLYEKIGFTNPYLEMRLKN